MHSSTDGRSQIKQTQIDILVILYKYRFGSRQLIAKALNSNPSTMYKKLLVLEKHGLINVRQEKRSKLYGIPSAYYLTPKSLKHLQSLADYSFIDQKIIKGSYRDKSVSESTVLYSFAVFDQILAMKRQYPALKAFMRRDMARFTYFPDNPPNAFLSLPDGDGTKRFFYDYIQDNLERKAIYQKIAAYYWFFDSGEWDVTGVDMPTILFVAEKASTERRVTRIIKGVINNIDTDVDLQILITTKRAVEQIDTEPVIWTSIEDPDDLLALDKAQ